MTQSTVGERIEPEASAQRPVASPQQSVGESVLRGALALLSTQPLTWGASLLLATVMPRLLGSDVLGQYAIVLTIAGVAAMVAGLGIAEYLVRRLAQQPESLREDAGMALTVQIISTVIVVLTIAVVAQFLPPTTASHPLLLVGLIPVLGAPPQTVLLSSFRGREQHRSYAWFNAAGVVSGAIVLVLVLLGGGSIVLSSAAAGSVGVATTLIGWRLSGVRPIMPSPRTVPWRELWIFAAGGLPFLSWQVTLFAYGQIDRLLLGIFVPTLEIGWYAAAYQIIGIAVFVPTLVIAALYPALSRSLNDPEVVRKRITRTLRLLLVIMGLLCVGSIVVAPGVPTFFGWPADFANAVPLMIILALHLPIVAVDMVLGAVVMAMHRESKLVIVGLVALVFNLGGNLLAIPFFQQALGNGAVGSSIVTVLTEILMCIGAVILIPKHVVDTSVAWQALRLVFGGVLSAVAGLTVLTELTGSVHIVVALVAAASCGTIVYSVSALILRAVSVDDVRPLLAGLPSGAR